MNAYETYMDYMALKAHFNTTYDYQKYHGKVQTSESATSFMRDKYFFEKISRYKDPHKFLLANILEDNKVYVRDIIYDDQANNRYIKLVARYESLGYLFKQDIKKIHDDYKHDSPAEMTHPQIVVLYLGNKILLETLCIVVKESSVLQLWMDKYPGDPLMEMVIHKITKYTPFIEYDREKFKKLMDDEFRDR